MNYQDKIEQVKKAYEARNQFYAIVSPIVGEIYAKQGKRALKEFSEDVREALGKDDVSFNTLETYAWFHTRVGHLDLPEDLSHSAIQAIASIKDEDKRRKFVELVKKQGLQSHEIVYKLKYK